jgi:hypothetical protein
MNRLKIFYLFLLLGFSLTAAATEYLKLTPTAHKASFYPFGQVEIWDARVDTSIGFVQKGPVDVKYLVYTNQSLAADLTSLGQQVLTTAKKDTSARLLVYIRQFRIYEKTMGTSTNGYFVLEADCFLKQPDAVTKVYSVDTIYKTKSMDVTQQLYRLVNETMNDLLTTCATAPPTANSRNWTMDEIQRLSEIEKETIPIYREKPKKGIYATREAFISNTPLTTPVMVQKESKQPSVHYERANGDKGYTYTKDFYAVGDGTNLFIKADDRLCPVFIENGDFHFIGPESLSGYKGYINPASTFVGDLAPPNYRFYEYIINPHNGRFIPVKRVNDPSKTTKP